MGKTCFTDKEINQLRESYFVGSTTSGIEIFEEKLLDEENGDVEYLKYQGLMRKIGFITLDDQDFVEEYEFDKNLVKKILKNIPNNTA